MSQTILFQLLGILGRFGREFGLVVILERFVIGNPYERVIEIYSDSYQISYG
jgi:hypothetical protein